MAPTAHCRQMTQRLKKLAPEKGSCAEHTATSHNVLLTYQSTNC